MRRHDFECRVCGMVREDVVRSADDESPELCDCGAEMKRLFPTSVGMQWKEGHAPRYDDDKRKYIKGHEDALATDPVYAQKFKEGKLKIGTGREI